MQIKHNELVKFVQYYLYARSSFSLNLNIIIKIFFCTFQYLFKNRSYNLYIAISCKIVDFIKDKKINFVSFFFNKTFLIFRKSDSDQDNLSRQSRSDNIFRQSRSGNMFRQSRSANENVFRQSRAENLFRQSRSVNEMMRRSPQENLFRQSRSTVDTGKGGYN